MSIRNLIILSQLNPPAQRNQILKRDRINQRLKTALEFPLTILEAGTGYGKSTALISFINESPLPVYWYTLAGPDRDPSLFTAKLFTAFNQLGEEIGEEALRILDLPDSTQQEAMIIFINSLAIKLKQPSLLVLDDYHRVYDVLEVSNLMNWFIENLPPQLHVIIATRRSLHFSSMNKWRVKRMMLEINKEELMFTPEEIRILFTQHYGINLTTADIEKLYQKTEGWAIGLQVVWQSMQNNPDLEVSRVLEGEMDSKAALFDYLAEEVLSRLKPEIQDFLIKTSILSKLDSETCDFLLNTNQSDRILRNLHETGLFIEELQPNIYRYHQIFQEFLQNRLQQDQQLTFELHRKIASYFTAHEYWERAISHLLLAGDYRQVNQVLENIGEQMIQKGRYESISYWVNTFPETIRKNYPYLFFLMGEVNRYTSKFEAALESYRTAEQQYREANNAWGISISLRGQARVYLDTIRPLNADRLLQESLKYLDPAETPVDVADLLTLTAENQLNLGYPDRAEELLEQSTRLNTFDSENNLILARLYLRTGRLKEGIELLEAREAAHPVSSSIARPQRFHREASLLLSLFYAIRGEIRQAYQFAQRGIWIGEQLQSTFVQSVGYMRLGHALQLQNSNPWTEKGFKRAIEYYHESIEKVDVSRIHVEPLWGMCRALGYNGQIQKAEELALESLAIAQKSGDEWIMVLIRISLGAGEVLANNHDKANHYLTLAESSAAIIKDPFILTVAQLWLAINAWQVNAFDRAFAYLQAFLPRLREHHYEFLVMDETFLGLKDREMIMPLLLAARDNTIEVELVNEILNDLNRVELNYHPGFTLWVRTLDTFNVWRGSQLIQAGEWKREKAKYLFQLLVGNRGKWLHRDQIISILWPDTPMETAGNSLKVTLNALNQALEPERPRGKEPYFIERKQELYRLNPDALIHIDTDIFEQSINEGTEIGLRTAVDLYETRYFADSYIQEWLMVDDQYYHQQYLLAADQLIQMYIHDEKLDEALDITYRILAIDYLWEPAYRLQMEIFYRMGRMAMVHSVYNQCKRVLESELNVPVSAQLTNLYEELIQKELG